MKTTPDNAPSTPDFSGLSAAEMATVISDLQQQLASKEEAFLNQEAKLKLQSSALERRDQAIQSRDARIEILEELLRHKEDPAVRSQ